MTQFPAGHQVIIRCPPCEVTGLPAKTLPILAAAVTVLHSRVDCQECGKQCWIGPGQVSIRTENPTSKVVCWICIMAIAKYRDDLLDYSKVTIARQATKDAPQRSTGWMVT